MKVSYEPVEGMTEVAFVPLVDGERLVDEAGENVAIIVGAPLEENAEITFETYVDGEKVETEEGNEKQYYVLPDQVYDVLKWVGLLFLPTLAWVYTMLAGAWGLPYAEEIPFTLNVIGTMVAVLIGASSINNIVKGA